MGFKNVIVSTGHCFISGTGRVAAAGVVVCAMLLSACGQRGNLYLPTEPAARNRATLPQTILPWVDETSTAPSSNPSVSITAPLTAPATPSSASR